jgi:hypothetical protein
VWAFKVSHLARELHYLPARGILLARIAILTAGVVQTAEPEIVKTILSTKSDDFALSHRRIRAVNLSFSHGIFASGGAAWKRSRELTCSSFAHTQGVTLALSRHTYITLNQRRPRDGSVVDLKPSRFFTECGLGNRVPVWEVHQLSRSSWCGKTLRI